MKASEAAADRLRAALGAPEDYHEPGSAKAKKGSVSSPAKYSLLYSIHRLHRRWMWGRIVGAAS